MGVAPMTRSPQPERMLGDICGACFRQHPPPACAHSPDAPCVQCGHARGFLWDDTGPRDTCWFCATGEPRPALRTTPLRKPDDEVWM